jgi:hypothetical protein
MYNASTAKTLNEFTARERLGCDKAGYKESSHCSWLIDIIVESGPLRPREIEMQLLISKKRWLKLLAVIFMMVMMFAAVLVVLMTQKTVLTAKANDVPLPPYPPSPVILGVEWAPAGTIQRAALGSDNWSTTWADDGHLYTGYADGWGFEPQISTKLSLGFARVEGDPADFQGVNLRSDDEQTGDGRRGKKASSFLMVDGVLYMWVRNANNNGRHCQLAHSTDYSENWTWSDWRFQEFGFCIFINYGQNYAGARDSYVYVVSHNGHDAYAAADEFILMRVPKESILQRSAYEFFVGLDANHNPLWSANIEDRGPVFENPGRALRSSINYNQPLGRYIWWQQDPTTGGAGGVDTRFQGGFGIYDAPEPWGPWTTVYYTAQWDVGPGEHGNFPAKWMSSDGRTMHLIFSGDDAFSVRQVTLTTVPLLPPECPRDEAVAPERQPLRLLSSNLAAVCLYLPVVRKP